MSERFKALENQVSARRKLLTDDQGIAGTDLGTFDLLRLKGNYSAFEKDCLDQLKASDSCTGTFNIAGRKIDVEVILPKADLKTDQVTIGISNPTSGAMRKAVFKAPAKDL